MSHIKENTQSIDKLVCLRRVLEVNVMDRIRNKDIRER